MSLDIKNIFIVDDDEMLSEMLVDHLSKSGSYNIKIFSTGEECLMHLNEHPDIIILDFNLNSIHQEAANGLHILQAVKNRDKDILVIMYSSQEQYGSVLHSIGKDAIQYVIKDQDAFLKIERIIKNL